MGILAGLWLQRELLPHGSQLGSGGGGSCSSLYFLLPLLLLALSSLVTPRAGVILLSGACVPPCSRHRICVFWFLCALWLCFAFCACGYVSSNFITATCQLLTCVHSFQVRLKVGIPDSSVSITWASNFSHDCDFWGLSSRLGLAKYFNYYVGVSVAISFYE